MKKFVAALALASCLGCSSTPLAPEDAHGERAAPGEAALNEEIAALSIAVARRERVNASDPMRRDAHAKAHGCVRATFTVDADVPTELRMGVFAEPGKAYPAWIRFSSGSSAVKDDKKSDARGMAIKLMGVEGEKLLASERTAGTQDFLLITHDAFFVKNSADYVEFFRLLAKGSSPAWFFFGRLPWRWKEFSAARRILSNGKKVLNPLFGAYFSATPYLLGDRNVVKHAVEPCAPDTGARSSAPDYLRLNMMKSLDVREGTPACFRFLVQRRSDPGTMSVEDSRLPWDRERAPFTRVATIAVPVQEFASEGQMRFCENLSFTPWHALPAHRPLGNINRTRKAAYEAVSAFRHDANGSRRAEPAPGDEL